jgi:hypothetical protein
MCKNNSGTTRTSEAVMNFVKKLHTFLDWRMAGWKFVNFGMDIVVVIVITF